MISEGKLKFYLYNLDSLENQIKNMESDIIDTGQIGLKAWLKSRHHYIGTIENQAIILAESKELNRLKKLKKDLEGSLENIKINYPYIFEIIKLKYFEKNKSIDIKQKLNIEYAEQEQYDLRAISLISNYLENK